MFNNSVNRYNVLSQDHLDQYCPILLESSEVDPPRIPRFNYASKPTAATGSNPNYNLFGGGDEVSSPKQLTASNQNALLSLMS